MFGPTDPDGGAVVGKFAGSPVHNIFSTDDLEDDFDWDVYDNVSFDPGLAVTPPDLKVVRYGEEYRGADRTAAGATDEAAAAVDDDMAAELDDLAAQLSALTSGGGAPDFDDDMEDEAYGDDEAGGGVQVLGPDNEIRNYAPNLPFSTVGLPFPSDPEAADYGASPMRVWAGSAGQ